ncbi:MAG: YiiX/YebB-like N1pC/P60 family cysteine hydrolase [Candidatus Paceibacterota bacterium]|jgi:hypothetical protein
MDLQPGDILVFKRSGPVSFILGGILKLFEKDYDFWGWHVGFIAHYAKGWMICEALGNGVSLTPLSHYKPENIRVYRWLDNPSQEKINRFVADYLGKPYDVAVYFWTALQYLLRHFWNRPIPKLLDGSFTCWELVFEFAEEMQKRIGSKYDCPLITDMLRTIKHTQVS